MYQAEATTLINYAIAAKTQTMRMLMMDNMNENGIGFSCQGAITYSSCADNADNSACQFFNLYHVHGNGKRTGGMDYLRLKREVFNLNITNAAYIADTNYAYKAINCGGSDIAKTVRIKGVGNDNLADLVITVPALNTDFCRKINETLGYGPVLFNLSTSLFVNYLNTTTSAYTSFQEPSGSSKVGDTYPELIGKEMFCYVDNSFFSGQWAMFAAVIHPR